MFSLSTGVCQFPVLRRETLYPRDFRNRKYLNVQTLWVNRPMHVHLFKLFCLICRYLKCFWIVNITGFLMVFLFYDVYFSFLWIIIRNLSFMWRKKLVAFFLLFSYTNMNQKILGLLSMCLVFDSWIIQNVHVFTSIVLKIAN